MRNVKRMLAVLLAVLMLLPSVLIPGLAAGGYSDVPDNAWYAKAVAYVTEHGYMNGVSETEFAPGVNVNRGMFVTVLARVAGVELNNNQETAFADVPEGKFYTGAVAWAAEKGIVNGVSETSFAPTANITRQDLCTILARFLNVMQYDLPVLENKTFSDSKRIASYAKSAVQLCAETGLVSGYDDGTFRPKGKATRAQVATIIMRLDLALNGEPVDPVPMPAQEFNGAAGEDMSVAVNAPEGALPENTNMTVSRVTDEAALAAIQEKVNGAVYAAADISFSKDGAELEPAAAVEVQISLEGLEALENPVVFHIKDDGSAERVNAELVSVTRGNDKALRFYAKDFSIYVVVDDGSTNQYARIQVNFVNPDKSSEPYAVMYAKNGDTGADLKKTIYDPGIGETLGQNGKNELFVGWIMSEVLPIADEAPAAPAYTVDTERKTIQDVRDYLEGLTIREGTKIYVYPMIFKVYTVSYIGEDGTTLAAKAVLLPRNDTNVDFAVEQSYTPVSNLQSFVGWIPRDGGAAIDSATYNDQTATAPYKPGTKLVIKGDVTFDVRAPKGFWLVFEENLKGATYNAPRFVEEHTNTSDEGLLEMKCKGYTFTHWCKNENCTNGEDCPDKFEFGHEITKATTIYAQWAMDLNATYTILVWKQTVNDAWDADDADKTYDFAFAVEKTVTRPSATTEINVTDTLVTDALAAYQNKDGGSITEGGKTYSFNGFKYNTTKGSNGVVVNPDGKGNPVTTILPNGTTVINLYYDRDIITYTFRIPQYTQVPNPSWNSSNQYFALYTDGKYYEVDSNGYFYITADTIDRTATYYAYLSLSAGSGYYEMSYLEYNNSGVYYWMAYVNNRWTRITNITTEQYESGMLCDRHSARYGDQITEYTYNTYSGNPTRSNYNTSNYFWVLINGTYTVLTYYGYGYGTYYYQVNGSGDYYSFTQLRNRYGSIYTRTTTTRTQTYNVYTRALVERETYTGLYDQKLLEASDDYIWPSDYRWVLRENLTGSFISVQDQFKKSWNSNPTDPNHTDFYGKSEDFNTYVWHIMQNVDGTWPEVTESTLKISTVIGNGMIFREFSGFTEKEYRVKLPDGVTTYRLASAVTNTGTQEDPEYSYTYDGGEKSVNSDGWTDWIPENRTLVYDGDYPDDMNHHEATAGGIEFRYERVKKDITYMVGKFVDKDGNALTGPLTGTLHQDTGIFYNASLADYAEGGAKYYDLSDKTIPEEFVFAGWYIDDTCTTLYAFEEHNMPVNGVVVYAKFVQKQYRVYLHPNTTDPTMYYGSENQSTCFRVDYDEQISVPEPRRDDSGYVLVGWYLDEDLTKPFTQGTFKANDTNVTEEYDWDVDMTETDKYGEVTSNVNSDKTANRVWILRKLDLYAKWRQLLDGSDGIGVEYTADDGKGHVGSNAPTGDTNLYQDNADAIAQGACTAPATSGTDTPLQFVYWVVQKYNHLDDNGNPVYVDTDAVAYPGGNYSVKAADAYKVQTSGEGEDLRYQYTVRLRAEYAEAEDEFPTHIIWHGNGGTTTIASADGTVYPTEIREKAVRINEAVSIRADESFTRPGYVFLGWARIDESDDQGHQLTLPEEMDLDADDLWLVYHPGTENRDGTGSGAYFTVNEQGFTDEYHATKIAADEHLKYHTLYAVWGKSSFYVYHSSSGKLEAIPVEMEETTSDGQTKMQPKEYDLTVLVAENHLYGGYYNTYGGVVASEVEKAAKQHEYGKSDGWSTSTAGLFDVSEMTSVEGDGFEPYTGESLKIENGSKKFWEKTDAYTDQPGNALRPTPGVIYYLKEVPADYLTPKFVYIYDFNQDNKLINFFEVTAVDDNNYSSIGFSHGDGANDAALIAARDGTLTVKDKLATSFKVVQSGNDLPEDDPMHRDPVEIRIDAEKFGLPRCYVAVKEVTSTVLGKNGDYTYALMPSWETLDGVKVDGRSNYSITIPADKKITLTGETNPENGNPVANSLNTNKLGGVAPKGYLYVDVSSATCGTASWETGALTKVCFDDEIWVNPTAKKNGLYMVRIPASASACNVVRIDPEGTDDDMWNNKLNQSQDVTDLSAAKNLIKVNSDLDDDDNNGYTSDYYNPYPKQ